MKTIRTNTFESCDGIVSVNELHVSFPSSSCSLLDRSLRWFCRKKGNAALAHASSRQQCRARSLPSRERSLARPRPTSRPAESSPCIRQSLPKKRQQELFGSATFLAGKVPARFASLCETVRGARLRRPVGPATSLRSCGAAG